MTAPRRRIWLYAPDNDEDALEVTLLGDPTEIAPSFAAIKSLAERWEGFERVAIVGNGTACGVLRMSLTSSARYDDPLAEGMAMFSGAVGKLPVRFEWCTSDKPRMGIVGTW